MLQSDASPFVCFFFFFSSRRRHTRWPRDWSSDVCSSDLSDAARTRETWEHVAAQMPGLDAEVTFHEEIYAGGPSEVLELLHGSEDRHPVVMVVGHEPTVASLGARDRKSVVQGKS